jgi:hypothetical protein
VRPVRSFVQRRFASRENRSVRATKTASVNELIHRQNCRRAESLLTLVAPCTQEHAPIKIDLPSLPDATTPLVRSAQNPTFSDVLSQEPGPRSNFVLLPDQKANAAKQDICVNVVRATGSNGLTVTSRGRELGADMVPAGSIDSVGTGDHAAARGHQRVG